jgi:hypothetical protein
MSEEDFTELDGKPTAFILGRISGQLRELIHAIASVQQSQIALGVRLAKLEEAESQRRGAANIIGLVLKSPALGWVVGAATATWAILTGKVHP